jgi:hypothetical protein
MAAQLSFIPSEGNYRFSSSLATSAGNRSYTFDVRWNTRDEAWRFDMYDPDGILMVAGVKIVLNSYLGRRSTHPFFNGNVLAAVDTSIYGIDPGFDDLGTRVQVWHYTASDLASLLLA